RPGHQADHRRRAPRQVQAERRAARSRRGHLTGTVTDLLALAAELVDIPSVSGDEQAIVARIERDLAAVPWLELTRVGDNLVARTDQGHPMRLVLAGHTDTVP